MTNMSNMGMTLVEFERLLDVYGGDRTRWPADARAAAAQLVARDPRAQRALAESEALERLLERAPLPSLGVEAALADRIVAAAQRSPRIVSIAAGQPSAQSSVMPLPSGGVAASRQAAPSRPRSLRREAQAAAVLAASLMVGIFIGASNVPQSVVPALADLAGTDRDGYSLALVEPFDEDVL